MGRAQEAAHRPQGRADLGQAQRRCMGGKVGEPQRFGQAAQVGEELRSPRQVDESLVVLVRQAGGDEVLELSRVVEDGDAAHPCAGQGARPVQDLLQHGIEVEVFGDVQAGLAQPEEPLPQRRYLPHRVVWSLHLVTSIGLRKAAMLPPSLTGGIRANRGNYAILFERLQEVIEKRPKGHGYITRGLYNWGWICPLTGDIHLAFDRPIPATETAGAPAASAAVPTALEAVFARYGFAQMVTPPPPDFRRQPVAGASLLRFKPPRLRCVAARPEHTPLSDGAPNAPGERARLLPTDSARPLSLIPTVAARDAPLGSRPWVPHLVYRRRLTPAIPLDGGPATALRNTHQEDKR